MDHEEQQRNDHTTIPARGQTGPPRPWGRLNGRQTYGVLARDLARALSLLDLPKYERVLIEEVRDRTWTRATRAKRAGSDWPDPAPCKLNLARLSRDLCPDARGRASVLRMLRRAKRGLLRKGLLRTEGARLFINQNVDEWPLKPGEIAWCRAAQPGPASGVTIRSPGGGDYPVTPGVTNQSPPGGQSSHPQGDNPVTPPRRNARGDLIQIQREHTPCVRGDTHGDLSPGEDETLAARAAELAARRRRRRAHDGGTGGPVVLPVASTSQAPLPPPEVGRVRRPGY